MYVSSISEKIGLITAISNLDAKPHSRKNNRIKSIHSSLKIEANSLSLGQVRDVINGKNVLGEQCIFMAPPARFVPQLMNELFNWMKEVHGYVHPRILSSVFHYEFFCPNQCG
ncbi:hypothetical protein ACTNB0_10140 [Lachnospiraceae bacterium HCP28S3_F9]